MDLTMFTQSLGLDFGAIAAQFGPWGLFGYLTLCKAASVYCNNTETKDTKTYKIAEFFADLGKKAKNK